jgi:hypothetical protein
MNNTICRVFQDTDMKNQHLGLKTIALSKKVNLDNLVPGEHVIFVNKACDKLKMYSHRGLLSYLRSDRGKLDLGMIQMIPVCFGSDGNINWKKAELLSLERKLKKVAPSKRKVTNQSGRASSEVSASL